jgi:general secretion pathway protein G
VCLMRNGNVAGFTLIEMLIAMSIIALLLTLAVPRYFDSVEKSKQVVLEENLRVLRISIDKFQADKGRYPSALSDLVEQKYLRAIPVDPFTESNETWIVISTSDSDALGISDVKSGAFGTNKNGKSYEDM